MSKDFEQVKQYLIEMGIAIVDEDSDNELVVVDDETNGIKNLMIDCEAPIVILEQLIMKSPAQSTSLFERLLQMNRELVHGAFVLDQKSEYVLYRDTLQLKNLDRGELEASIQALSLALAEFGEELLDYAKN